HSLFEATSVHISKATNILTMILRVSMRTPPLQAKPICHVRLSESGLRLGQLAQSSRSATVLSALHGGRCMVSAMRSALCGQHRMIGSGGPAGGQRGAAPLAGCRLLATCPTAVMLD